MAKGRLRHTRIEVKEVLEIIDSGLETGIQSLAADLLDLAAVELEVGQFVGIARHPGWLVFHNVSEVVEVGEIGVSSE